MREIKYYQSAALDDCLLLPQHSFRNLVEEIVVKDLGMRLRWEKDALVCLQTMTEHVMIMVFELLYVLIYSSLISGKGLPFMQNASLSQQMT